MGSPCLAAKARNRAPRATVPSSSTTSPITATGGSPAIRARSTAASVCPARRNTPPSTARNGNTCPGRFRSPGLVSGSASREIVCARSAAEIPVVIPVRAFTDTAYPVPRGSSLTATIGGSASRSRSAAGMGTHRMPLVCRTMNATRSGVAYAAASMRSPSSSGFSASTTITIRPERNAATATPTGSPKRPARRRKPITGMFRTRAGCLAGVRAGIPCGPIPCAAVQE